MSSFSGGRVLRGLGRLSPHTDRFATADETLPSTDEDRAPRPRDPMTVIAAVCASGRLDDPACRFAAHEDPLDVQSETRLETKLGEQFDAW